MSYRIVSMAIIILLVFGSFVLITHFPSDIATALPSHATIEIVGDANFTTANGVTNGSGTEGDPYIIENYDIAASTADGIKIRNTDAYFIIQNVDIHNGRAAGNDGISLFNVRNGTIRNSTFNNNWYGIELSGCENIIIKNNTLKNNNNGLSLKSGSTNNQILINDLSLNTGAGIELDSSDNNEIIKNNLTGHNYGIYLSSSDSNNITDNYVRTGTNACIFLTASTDNYIFANNVTQSSFALIYLGSCSKNNVSSNNVWTSVYYGIYLIGAVNNNIYANTVKDTDYAIYVWSGSNNNIVEANRCTENFAGINLRNSGAVTVIHNRIFNNSHYGIYTVGTSNNNNISYNYVDDNGWGIQFEFPSGGNIILHNYCVNNYAGIHFQESPSSNNDIGHNRLIDNELGIRLGSASSNHVYANSVEGGRIGLQIDGASGNELSGNIISSITETGIYLSSAVSTTAVNNELTGCGFFIEGTSLSNWNTHTIDATNTINGKPLRYYSDQSGAIVPPDCGQIILAGSDAIAITDLSLSNATCPVLVGFSSDITIINSVFKTNSRYGITLYFSWNIKIENNTFSQNRMNGLNLEDSSSNIVKYNNFNNNNGSGIQLDSSGGNLVINNSISTCKNGIEIVDSDSNTVFGNEISACGNGTVLFGSSYNLIYRNSMLSNLKQASDNGITNTWNGEYPQCGNFWSDYGGVDNYAGKDQDHAGSDGVGDTPYSINLQIRDEYPLIHPPGIVKPQAPENILAFAGDSFVKLTWSHPASPGSFPVINFSLYRGIESNTLALHAVTGNNTEFNDTSAVNGQKYYYRVSATSIIGEGELSSEISAIPVEVIPDAVVPREPLNLTARTGSDFIMLSWEPPFYDGGATITSYKLYKDTISGTTTNFIELGNTLFYNDTQVVKGISYYYKIKAVNTVGEGALSEEIKAVIKTVPDPPTNLSAVAGDLYVYLSWQKPKSDGGSPIQKYNVYRRTSGEDAFVLVKSRVVPYYNDTEVESGVSYTYVVTSVNGLGEGPDSEKVNAKPVKKLKPPYVNVTLDKNSGEAPLTVKFEASATAIEGIISSYFWDFDDGNTSSEKSPEHTFEQPGIYNVTLTVTDNKDMQTTLFFIISVLKQPGPPPDDGGPDDGDDKKHEGAPDDSESSKWALAAQVTVVLGILLILIIFALSLLLSRKKLVARKRGPPPKRITIKKRSRHIAGELPPDIAEYDIEYLEE